ncbi:MAG: alpha-ketoglutarate-dependent dioxygenase AlkB [Bacteroidetes bacterium]|nr:alpha-ketoglutarate-dependent dioxygenase AlkB [Bacteroidota bacterium]
MNTLFPIPPQQPEGFSYIENFISTEEERGLVEVIAGLQLRTFTFRGYEAKRLVRSYGYDYHFDSRSISKGEEVPGGLHLLIDKVASHLSIEADAFAEVLVTEYPPGAVINWHRDAPPFDLIAGISLQADCNFRLRPYDKAKQGRNAIVSFPVLRRSLYVMQGPARSDWEHSIMPVKSQRYSVTLRTLR